jgi:hypothetical protein
VLLAATIGAFAFMLSSLWATLRVTFVGVPESAPEENEAEGTRRRPLLALRVRLSRFRGCPLTKEKRDERTRTQTQT